MLVLNPLAWVGAALHLGVLGSPVDHDAHVSPDDPISQENKNSFRVRGGPSARLAPEGGSADFHTWPCEGGAGIDISQ